ncbi:MAG: thioredoxin domain-containing protein [Solirubrobacteraceae bacterium]
MEVPFALAGGSWILLAAMVVVFFAVAFGYYTRRGSGINQTPYRRPGGPPETPSELAHDTTQELRNWDRGTGGHHRTYRPAGARQPPAEVAQALADWRARSRTAPALDPPIGAADRVRGPGQAPTVTVYLDVASEPCRSAYQLLCELADAQRIRLAVRQLPLADVHELSLPAAEVLEAAAAQERFFEVLDRLTNSGARDEAELLDLATRDIPDPDRLKQEVSDGRYQASVVAQIRQATASGAHGVPEIYINGSRYGGAVRRDDLDRTLRRLPAP